MHHSRAGVMVIDCHTEHLAASTEFWSRALGKTVNLASNNTNGSYVELHADTGQPPVLLRRVDQPSDNTPRIETDDLEAEVARLELLGAYRTSFLRGRWWGMHAPSGEDFTVVKSHKLTGKHLNCWHRNADISPAEVNAEPQL